MNEFYLVLPSNSSMGEFIPENTLAQYKTRLPEPITLNDDDYEVGLQEIHYPHNWSMDIIDYSDTVIWLSVTDTKEGVIKMNHMINFKDKTFHHIDDMAEYANKTMQKINPAIKIGYDRKSYRYFLTNAKTDDTFYQINMSNKSGRLFGFEPNQIFNWGNQTRITAFHPIKPTPSQSFNYIFVYTDIVDNSVVGNVKAPLLRVIGVRGQPGDVCSTVFEQPLYYPLLKRSFQTIELALRDDSGKLIPFADAGRVITVLHIRKR